MSESTDDVSGDARTWFGYQRSSELVGGREADVVVVPSTAWPEEHRRRLVQTENIDGLVPTVGVTRTFDEVKAYQLPAPGRSFTEALDGRSVSGFDEIVSATEAAAEATHAGHLTGLVHGALGTDDIRVVGSEIAVAGMGLGRGGTAEADRSDYVAPEVLAGGTPNVRSDVYSLGRVLEKGLGRTQGQIPSDAQQLISEATNAEPSNRPPSARSFADRLGALPGRRRRRHGLAALGSSEAARQLSDAVNNRTGGLAGAGAAAAVGGATVAVGAAGFAASRKEPTTAAAVAATPPESDGRRGRRRAGWVLAGLVGVGGLGLWALTRDNDGDVADTEAASEVQQSVDDATEDPTTTVAPATTEAPTTTIAPTTTAVPTTAAPTTTEATTTITGPADPPPVAALSAADATGSFEILHAVPGVDVDAYINGELAAPGFSPGNLAGPLSLDAAGQPVDLFVAQDNPPDSVDDRDDKPVLAGPLDIDGSGTLVAFVDAEGTPMLQAFGNNLDPIEPGQSRFAVRHVAAMGPATVLLDGDEVATEVPSGSSAVVDVPAGAHVLTVVDADGNELYTQEIDSAEGELTTAWVRGDEGDLTTLIRRIDGLQTAPTAIPSGDTGLVDDSFSATGDGLIPGLVLMVVLAGAGFVVVQRRSATVPGATGPRVD
ncbi:MAG: hypothetical protein ACI8TP_000273 [Acidimicrobiales bacterium]|jgi:hypothetical protein